MVRFSAVWLLFAPALACADLTELYTWHTVDTLVASKGRTDVYLHHRTRSRQELQFLEQSRYGGIARFYGSSRSPRFFWLAGYYYQPNHSLDGGWFKGHRAWGGFESQPVVKPGYAILFRAVSERHINTGRPSYFRHRTALRWTGGAGSRKVRPFVQNEVLAVWPGFHSTRNSGGLAVRLSPEWLLEAAYLYDTRRTFWGGDRQAVVTSFRWTPKSIRLARR